MKYYEDIKDLGERCKTHPDHQRGVISRSMLVQMLDQEVQELRAYIEGIEWVGLTDDEIEHLCNDQPWWMVRDIEAKLKEKNT